MLLVVGENAQILQLVPVHHAGFSNDLYFGNWLDPHRNVRQFLSLGVRRSNVDRAWVTPDVSQLHEPSEVAILVVGR